MNDDRITNWEQLKGLPKGTVVRVPGNMPPPPGFTRSERGVYVLGRVEYSGSHISPNRDTMLEMGGTIRVCGKDFHFNNTGCSTIYEEEWMEATGAVDVSVSFDIVKADFWFCGVVFRVNGRWYNNFPAYLTGKTTPFETAQDAVDALVAQQVKTTDSRWSEFASESVPLSFSMEVEVEKKKAAQIAAEKKARREAEDAEMAALEAELADLERQEKLKQLRAKVAQMKEGVAHAS